MGSNIYQITTRSISKLLHMKDEAKLLCYRCREEIVPGVWVRRSGHFSRIKYGVRDYSLSKLYHLSCWENMFLDV